MRLQVDWDLCQGHGKCYLIAPHLFAPDPEDDWGKAIVLVEDLEAEDSRVADARAAIGSCPEYAITLATGRSLP